MARREWGHNGRGKWCSYKRTTLIVCSVNIFVALYVLRNLYTSVYVYPFSDSHTCKSAFVKRFDCYGFLDSTFVTLEFFEDPFGIFVD